MTRPSACAVAATASRETPSRADINFDMTSKPPEAIATSAHAKRAPRWVPVALESAYRQQLRPNHGDGATKDCKRRSAERRVGKECVRTGRSRRSPYHLKTKKTLQQSTRKYNQRNT